MARSTDLKTPLVRLAFMNLLKPRKSDFEGKPDSYQATLLIPKTEDITALKNAAAQAAIEEWGDKAKEFWANGLIKTPFLDGDGPQALNKTTGKRNAGHEGHVFIRAGATLDYPPKLFDAKVQPVVSPDEIYSGCYGYAVIHFFTWDNPKNGKGVSAGITMFQKVKDGEKFGVAERPATDFFETVGDTGGEPSKVADGAGGLFA